MTLNRNNCRIILLIAFYSIGIVIAQERNMQLIFEARPGEPIVAEYLSEGIAAPVWAGIPLLVALGKDGSIYLPTPKGVLILSREGKYLRSIEIQPDQMSPAYLGMKCFIGVDPDDNPWFFIPYNDMSPPPGTDYRHTLFSTNSNGIIENLIRLSTQVDKKLTWSATMLNNGNIHLNSKRAENSWLVDCKGGETLIPWVSYIDTKGNGYDLTVSVQNTTTGQFHYSVKKVSLQVSKNISNNDASILNSIDQYLTKNSSFPLWSGSNRQGCFAIMVATSPPKGYLIGPYFEYIICDDSHANVNEHGFYNWNTPPETTPSIKFTQLEDDNSFLLGVAIPLKPWDVDLPPGGGMPIFTPGPDEQVFRIYRLK